MTATGLVAIITARLDKVDPPRTSAEGYPAWVQPTGGHDAYAKGARVSFEGSDYESLIDGNVWSPTGYPAGWLKL